MSKKILVKLKEDLEHALDTLRSEGVINRSQILTKILSEKDKNSAIRKSELNLLFDIYFYLSRIPREWFLDEMDKTLSISLLKHCINLIEKYIKPKPDFSLVWKAVTEEILEDCHWAVSQKKNIPNLSVRYSLDENSERVSIYAGGEEIITHTETASANISQQCDERKRVQEILLGLIF